jgi:AhpD family alkylhydroperoxidase
MDWKAELAEAGRNLSVYRRAQPDTAAGFTALSKAAMAPGVLDVRQKELLCIAIGIIRQCDDCIGFHVKAALAAGVTREEVAETVSVTLYMGGGPAYMYGARALAAYDELVTG